MGGGGGRARKEERVEGGGTNKGEAKREGNSMEGMNTGRNKRKE